MSGSWKDSHHSVFSDATADVVLQSLEGTLYRVPSFVLRTTSGFFRTMLSLPQPADAKTTHEIPVGEHDGVMERVLRMMCGMEIPPWSSFDELESALELMEKWDTPGPLSFARTALPGPMFAAEPLRVYLVATRFGWQPETTAALLQTLQLDLLSGKHEEHLCKLSSRSLLQLVTFHDRCKTRFRASLDGTELFSAGNQEPYECACGKRRDNYPWRALKNKIIAEYNRRPIGDHILVEMV
ncbi:BTB domain-containing protein [Mycena kentingensis (nom. inval.)]|nr:BTB domain-containing protein [Mycena kentingensis (nom. inval.)]